MHAKPQKTENTLHKAHEICTRSGQKLTPKRAAILTVLIESRQPLSAYEVVANYNQTQSHPIQPMSAYRILNFLQSEKLVHKLETQNKYIACAHINCSHPHSIPHFLVCRQCQQVQEIHIPEHIVDELSRHARHSGFTLDQSQIELDGLCDKCRDQ